MLSGCKLLFDMNLIQYADDILIAATSAETCLTATRNVLLQLAEKGFMVSKSELQVVRQQVSF